MRIFRFFCQPLRLMDCDYDKEAFCKMCGKPTNDTKSKRRCEAGDGAVISLPKVAVGSAIESMLIKIGITKERVAAWLRVKDCGCEHRKNWLDNWGHEKRQQIERLLARAAKWYGIS